MRNWFKRTLGSALAVGMVVSALPAAGAVDLKDDYKGHWAESYIQDFVDAGLVNGDENGYVNPDSNITRAEFMAFVNRFYGYTKEASAETVAKYTDVEKDWYYSDIAKALAAGYINGTSSTTMEPNSAITRQEAMTIIGRILYGTDYKLEDSKIAELLKKFPDAGETEEWADDFAAALVEEGIIEGDEKGELNPTDNITRAESIKILCGISQYVQMNIPYAEFYAAELNNDVKVDGVTSATLNKTRTGGMMSGGSYHVNSDGSDITGVTYPVKIKRIDLLTGGYTQVADDRTISISVTNRGQTSTTNYVGKDSLFEADSYSYYPLAETPSSYKVATVNKDGSLSFGKATGEAAELKATAELTTSTTYGDYQVDIDLGKDADGNAVDAEKTFGTIYGVILSTKEGHDYGMRHLENVWRRTEIAWGSGYTTLVHNCPISSDHYKAMEGETITGITYITENGTFTISTELYVPVKEGVVSGLSTADAKVDAKTTDITAKLPSDYKAEYTAPAGFTVTDGKLTWDDTVLPGTYTLTVKDTSGKYASVSTTFTLSTDTAPAQAAEDTFSVVKTEAAADAEFANYLKNITKVNVNGTDYAASGRGAAKVIKTDGSIDFTTKPFQTAGVDGKYVLVISSTGYPDVTVTVQEYVYAYASLTYGEYWANEDVYAAGDTTSSETKDSNGETDKGGFDAVTRATTNHGLYRASFQQSATITCENGTKLEVDYFKDAKTLVLTDGTEVQYIGALSNDCYFILADGTRTKLASYTITGIKYVPVAVKSWEFSEFAKNYDVTVNGTTINGGSPNEGNVKPYTYVTEVNANTNGLKVATLTDGKWSFSARKTGTGSGLKGVELKTAPELTASVNASSKFGDFIRVDITDTAKQYGLLGAAMETVVWTYYGNDSTYTDALETYGTKFAADNWMHSKMSIQLGLSNSVRCQMPEGYDGTGYWTVTIYAMGYSDTTYKVQVKADDLHDSSAAMTAEQKTQLTELAAQVKALMDAYDEANATDAVKKAYADLSAHYTEVTDLLNAKNPTSAAAQELLTDLPVVIAAYNNAVEAGQTPASQTVESDEITIPNNEDDEWVGYTVKASVTVEGSTVKSVTVTATNPNESDKYLGWAVEGRENKGLAGVPAQYAEKSVEDAKAGTGIDAVTGATFTSNAIKEAVTNALNKLP